MSPARRGRGGFSLAELLLIMVLISILAGIAVPTMRKAIEQAAAAKIMTDVRNVTMAVRQYVEDSNGVLPSSTNWGEAPADMGEYLPEGSSFGYKTTTYRLVTQAVLGEVRMEVRYPVGDPIGLALQRFVGQDVSWTNTRLTAWILD